jgi:NhaA family Na+:H+ antiporter
LAIIDDLGAIIIIALFYTDQLSIVALAAASVGILGLVILNASGASRTTPYILVGIFIWVCVLKSGVHATLAGVIVAIAVPLRAPGRTPYSPLHHIKESLHPWVAFGVLPLFAFANAGVSLDGVAASRLLAPVPLGIALGLFAGKQAGIFLSSLAALKSGLARWPAGVTTLQLYGAAVLGGIGFTMSLFIGLLAFDDPSRAADVRIGVLAGSIASAIAGYLVLRLAATNLPQRIDKSAGRG